MSGALEITLKMSLIVASALAAVALLRHAAAALRHWILAAAIVCAALTPALRAALPAWEVPVGRPPAAPQLSTERQVGVAPPVSPQQPAPPARTGSPDGGPAGASRRPMRDLLVPIWMAGAAYGVALLIVALVRLALLAAHARPVDAGPWREICEEVASQYGIRRRVRLLQSDRPALLVTWGALIPKVILPAGALGWSPDRIKVVMAHELAHIRRRDWAAQMAAELLRAIYWFNPLFWFACRQLRRESELACDDTVLAAGIGPSEYASHLVALARELRPEQRGWVPAPAIVGPSLFERRIKAMLNANLNRRPLSGWRRIATAAAVAIMTGGIAVAQTSYARVSGVVTDQTGRVLPDATVRLTHVASGTRHEVHATAAGSYDLAGLQSGDYTLEAAQAGFASYRETLTLSPGEILPRNVTLQVGSLEETIMVVDSDTPPPARKAAQAPAWFTSDTRNCNSAAVGGNIRPPMKLVDVRPKYPINLRASNVEGKVNLDATIGIDGTIKEVSVVSSPSVDMSEAAMAAVRQWEFTPTLLNCAAIEVRMSVLVAFQPRGVSVSVKPQD
jgi:TonB family protein